jgi:large repetitive protein
MICNKWLGQSGRASSVISSSTLSSFGRFAAAIGAIARPALLLLFGVALCGAGVQAQTVYFAGAQSSLVSGLSTPNGVAVDASGNVFFAQSGSGSVGVYEIPAGCSSSTCMKTVTTSNLSSPQGVAMDASGNLYVADASNGLLKYTLSGGSYSSGSVIANGSSSPALANPQGVAVDASCNVYVSDRTSGNVYKYTPTSSGCAATSYTESATVAASLTGPAGLAVDASGSVYVAQDNTSGQVDKYTLSGGSYVQSIVTTVHLTDPSSVAVDALGNVYVGFFQGLNKYAPNGSGGYVLTSLGSGFAEPYGAAVDNKGDLYVTDASNNAAYEIQTQGVNLRSTAVGATSSSHTLLFNFTNTSNAKIKLPFALTQGAAGKDFAVASGGSCDATTNYSAGGNNSCTVNVTVKPASPGLRMGAVEIENTSGTVIATTYVYGNGTGPQVAFNSPVTTSTLGGGFNKPNAIAVDGSGNVYVADTLNNAVKVMPAGCATSSCVTTVGGGFNQPFGVAVDGAGNVYVADMLNNAVKEMPAVCASSSCVTTLGGGFSEPIGVAVDGSGNVYVGDTDNSAVKEIPAGCALSTCVTTVGGGFSHPSGVALDASGNVYVADIVNNTVKEMPAGCASTSCVTTLGGGFNQPFGAAVDGGGNVYVVDSTNNAVKEMPAGCATSSCVTTLGSGFSAPGGLALDASGNVYVADTDNNAAKQISRSAGPTISFATTAISSTSSDSPQSVTVANIGNTPLTIESAPTVAANFGLDSSSTCTTADSPVAVGSTCELALDFKPTQAGAPVTGTAILTTNSLNANTSPFATQVISMSGTATAASTTTSVASSANPSTATATVTFTATVTNTASGSLASPTGTVQFVVDGSNSGSPVSLTAATSTTSTASIQLSNLTVSGSPHAIKANYLNSDGNFVDSNGTLTGGQTVTAATATLAFTTVPSGAVTINSTANFTATLTVPTGSVKPAGKVVFSQGTTTLCTQAISASAPYTASCSTNKLVGPTPATVTANYTDTAGNFTVSTPATTSVTLTQVTTSLALTANPSTPTVDQATTLKAVLTVGSSSPNAPTGSISFTVNGVGVAGCSGTSPITLTLTGGVYGAQCTTSTLTATSSTIGATYSGDNNFANSAVGPTSVTVSAATPVFTISAAPVSPATTIIVNSPVQFTAAFSAPASIAPTQPKGPIVLTQAGSALCTIADVSVSLSCQAPGSAISAAGTHPITAAYTDSRTPPQFVSETYNNSSFTVTAGASNTSVSMTSGTAGVNQTATFTATVTSANSGTSTPQGTVTFQITDPAGKTTTICSPNVTLASGSAVCPYTFALSGAYSVKATYNPNPANFVTSFGTTSVTSTPDPTALTIGTANPTSPIVNQTYTLTATVMPTYPATGAGVIAPTGGSVSFYPSAASTTLLCKGTVTNTGTSAAPVYTASCTTTAAGSLSVGSYTISATYTDSASPANFVASSNTAPFVVQQDTPTVTPTAIPTSIQVNQPLTLNVTVKPTYSGPFAPTGQVAFKSGSTTLCTATLSAGSGNTETGSCTPSYQDLQVAASPYTITPTYIPDTAGSTNFKNPTNAPVNPGTAMVTVAAATTSVQVVPTVSAGTPGYAGQTVTYTATVTTIPAFPANSGVSPTGTITFTNTSGVAFAPTSCTPVTLPANAAFPYTAQCSVSYPLTYTGNNNTDTLTATYTSGDNNFTGNTSPLVQPVKNFSLTFTSSTVSGLVVSPGHTNASDPIIPNQTLASLAVSTASSGPGVFTDTLAHSCIVTSTSGATSNLPTCVAVPSSAAPSATAPIAYTVTVPSGASAGQYTVTVSASDATNAPTLIHTQVEPLVVVDTTSSQVTYSFTGAFAITQSVNFGAPSSFAPKNIWCPQILQTSGSLPSGVTSSSFANQGTLYSPGTSPPTFLACALGTSSNSGSTLSINITPCPAGSSNCTSGQAMVAPANKGVQKSNGSYAAVVLAMPLLIFFGWFGRNRARKSFFRMMTVLLLAWSALSISGCGGGFKLTTTGSSSAPTVLPVGSYQVMVAAQDASNNTYYAIVTVTVI